MIRVEALTLEDAFKDAAAQLECSVAEIDIEVVQSPSSGILGFFKKKAIVVAVKKNVAVAEEKAVSSHEPVVEQTSNQALDEGVEEEAPQTAAMLHDTIMPVSFVSDQDEEIGDGLEYTADYDDAFDDNEEEHLSIEIVAQEVQAEINKLFAHICFEIDEIRVSVYDEVTLLIEFQGEDAALLIGKEGYRYKSLSYMLFNWVNAKYNVGLRLEIAEFLKNQEESVARYLESVYESIERDGRAQTKILDGVLVQIALKELRQRYPEKYVVIRSTRDGLKYIMINDYHQ